MESEKFPPQTQAEFEKLAVNYIGRENTACLFACVEDGGNTNTGIVGDQVAILVLLVYLIRQIAKGSGAEFSDVLGALGEINTMDGN